jgi:hypothetical protein
MRAVKVPDSLERRHFIGGSDARIIMGQDEKALIRLWQEKRGEVGPEDLSGNLIVQLGLATEDLNRTWYERNTGRAITAVQARVKHPVIAFMAATLDGVVAGTGAVYEAGRCQRPTQSHQAFLRLRKRTPAPPPFSSMNSMPAASRAFCSFSRASSETLGPKPPSRRLMVGTDRSALKATSV